MNNHGDEHDEHFSPHYVDQDFVIRVIQIYCNNLKKQILLYAVLISVITTSVISLPVTIFTNENSEEIARNNSKINCERALILTNQQKLSLQTIIKTNKIFSELKNYHSNKINIQKILMKRKRLAKTSLKELEDLKSINCNNIIK